MTNFTSTVNEPITLAFKGTTGTPSFSDLIIFNDGTPVSNSGVTITEYSTTGIFIIRYTPVETGSHIIHVNGNIQAQIQVVSKSVYTFLKNIEDESLGSWVWDKQANTLSMLRQDGSPLASYTVVETLIEASRERVS